VTGALWRYGPAAVWAAVIFFLSSLQSPPGSGSVPDWLSHGTAYFVLSALLCRALRSDAVGTRGTRLIAAIALAAAYGVTDELHQSAVPGRDASVADVGKDLVGSALGAAGYAWWRRRNAAEPTTGAMAAMAEPSVGSPARRPGRR